MGPHINGTEGGTTRAVLDAVRRIVQALRESSRHAEQAVGVTGAQLFVLHKLAESPGQSLNDLAAATHTHQSSVSTVVSRLVACGLVHRRQAPSDGRRLVLTLSTSGHRLVRRAPEPAQESLIRSIERLALRERRSLAAALEHLVGGMAAGERTAAMFFDEEPRGRRRPAAAPRAARGATPPRAETARPARRRDRRG